MHSEVSTLPIIHRYRTKENVYDAIKIVDYYINIASYDGSRKKDKAVGFAYQHQIECKHTDLQTNLHGFIIHVRSCRHNFNTKTSKRKTLEKSKALIG